MTKHEQAKLSTKIREVIFELQLERRLTTAALAEEVLKLYPDLCEQEKDRLFRASIAEVARKIMKSTASTMKSGQFTLPMELAHLRLPASISLPPKPDINAETGAVAIPEDVLWVPLEDVTFAELELHLEMLGESIAKDQARFRSLKTVHSYLEPHMADDYREEAIGPMLAELAAQEEVS